MIPRFSNPHILETFTKFTSRAELKGSDLVGQSTDTANEDVPILTKRLRELVQDNLGNFTFNKAENSSRRKRQKLEKVSKEVESENPVCAFCSFVVSETAQCTSSIQYFD